MKNLCAQRKKLQRCEEEEAGKHAAAVLLLIRMSWIKLNKVEWMDRKKRREL